MHKKSLSRKRILFFTLLVLLVPGIALAAISGLRPETRVQAADPLDAAFQQAQQEFGVPADLLKAGLSGYVAHLLATK